MPTIIVRPAKAGEKLKTLDGQDRELSPENLVIADTAGAIALAGVMGGLETEVTRQDEDDPARIGGFDFVSVRKTARQFNLFSEASTRFSRGVHPEIAKPAAVRAAELFRRHAGGEVLAGIVDNYPAPPAPQVIELHRTEIARLLGFDVPAAEVERVLTALQFQVKPEGVRLDGDGAADAARHPGRRGRPDRGAGPRLRLRQAARAAAAAGAAGAEGQPGAGTGRQGPRPARRPGFAGGDHVLADE